MMGRAAVIFSVLVLSASAGGCGGGPSRETKASNSPDRPWPPLPDVGFITGRPATEDDVKAGNAVFVAKDGDQPIGRALDIAVPQFAIFMDEANHQRKKVIIVQAEQAHDTKLLGYREVETGTLGVGTFSEFELLGRDAQSK